jgi:hypothetical protein
MGLWLCAFTITFYSAKDVSLNINSFASSFVHVCVPSTIESWVIETTLGLPNEVSLKAR